MFESVIKTKIEKPTKLVSNMVVADSPKKQRICLDPRPLNKAIKTSHYPMPIADALMTKCNGMLESGYGKLLTIILSLIKQSKNTIILCIFNFDFTHIYYV